MQCKPPVEPVEFCHRLCKDAATIGHGGAQARYLNRLTPVSVIVKASENGLEEGARRVLADHFKLKPKTSAEGKEGGTEEVVGDENESPATVSLGCLHPFADLSLTTY